MKTVAGILLVVSVLIMFFGCALDTSVPTSMGGRVNNIGLMNDQTNIMMVGGVLFLASIVLFVAPRRERSADVSSVDEPKVKKEDSKEDPYDALARLADLRDRNALTEDEFVAAKRRLLETTDAAK